MVLLFLAVALVAALVGGLSGALIASRGTGSDTPRSVTIGAPASSVDLARPAGSVAAIARKVLPSVVSINVRAGNQSDTGSGVIISAAGYVLTNNHVVAPATGGGAIQVQFYGSTRSAPARIVGTDPQSDLAVVKVSGVQGLRVAALGSSSNLQVGDQVVAIGSPLGLTGTVTAGIVSAKDRPVRTGDTASQRAVIDAIQTDAAINPGNSGGALVDATGAVVGINSAIATLGGAGPFGGQSGNIGVGFAIPIDQASSIAKELIQTGRATHPVIGVQAETVGPDAGGAPGSPAGARLRSIIAGGGAAKAGLRAGDLIVAVDGAPVGSVDQLVVEIRKRRVGEAVTVTFVRGGATRTVSVTLGTDAG